MKKIIIIGGGFSGTMLALNLCAEQTACEVHIIEAREALGLGAAYSTDEAGHLLNVPATNMSAWPDKPHDFVGYLIDNNTQLAHMPLEYFSSYFAPRKVFGRYIQELASRPEYSSIIHHQATATRVVRSEYGLGVRLSNQEMLYADAVVLAVGLPASSAMDRIFGWAASGRYLSNAWDAYATRDFMTQVRPDDSILIIGSGLTMMDMLVSLEKHRVRGNIAIVSRHGLSPQVHAPCEAIKLIHKPHDLRSWLRIFREQTTNWRAVFDALRPESQALWQSMSLGQKSQFLRHLRPYWDSHRHRVAPEIHRLLRQGLAQKRISVQAGRLVKAETSNLGFTLNFQHRDRIFSLSAHRVINCTGPESRMLNFQGPLWAGLLKDGLLTLDGTGLGAHSDDFKATCQQGYEHNGLYILGALRRGTHWEATAVPELRADARRLAGILAANLS
jgi:uncharacterized NAD(P)/FAD-binding protein YdhS